MVKKTLLFAISLWLVLVALAFFTESELLTKQAAGYIFSIEEERFVTILEVQSNPVLVRDPESIEHVIVSPLTRIKYANGVKENRDNLTLGRGVTVTFLPISTNYQFATKLIIR